MARNFSGMSMWIRRINQTDPLEIEDRTMAIERTHKAIVISQCEMWTDKQEINYI